MVEADPLRAWEQRLAAAEAELADHERRAAHRDPSPGELLALAAERDRLAADRDALAQAHDDRAVQRDGSGLARDARSSLRDVDARQQDDDADRGFPDRWLAAVDRDEAAGDRAEAVADRRRAAEARRRSAGDRERAASDRDAAAERVAGYEAELQDLREALERRLVIGQAQGLLMGRYGISSDEAFGVLVRLSQEGGVRLRVVAARLVAEAEPGQPAVPAQ